MKASPIMLAVLSALLPAIGSAASTPAGHAVPAYTIQQRHELGGEGGWDYLSLDPTTHRIFIARNDRVMVVDANTSKLAGEISGMQHAHGVALATAQRRGYVSNGKGDNVSVIDLDALKVVGQIPLSGKNPDAIVFDDASGHVLTMNGHSNNISVIDPAAGKELSTIALSGKPEFAVSDGKGNLYVNLEDTSQLVHVDLKAGKVAHTWPLAPCDSPSGLAFDAANQRLFSVCDNQLMVVTDARDGHQVAKLPIGKGPDAAAFDPQAKLVFSSNGEGTLTVVRQDDADHYTVAANVPTQKGARTMALDAQQHLVYLVAANPAAKGAPVTGFTLLVAGSH
ncbi:40-residue YVTN family beta-propeller repeat-containing protein [Dyella sp. OK004]|uniref:YncE family protein n=1 Tax=Dyella sp. OK004 TaxID=1855292 RepID=UPI0008EC9B15|nr:YncE family protein [Dyella sp. OK004]SFR89005.1 40-residue YVTN family beta-propeller repeat-containing protein [Dyella sp. OK004]